MKKKEIITLIVSLLVIGVSVYFLLQMIAPKKTVTKSSTTQNMTIPTEFDEKTIQEINNLSDYGKPSLDGLGKSNLFGF